MYLGKCWPPWSTTDIWIRQILQVHWWEDRRNRHTKYSHTYIQKSRYCRFCHSSTHSIYLGDTITGIQKWWRRFLNMGTDTRVESRGIIFDINSLHGNPSIWNTGIQYSDYQYSNSVQCCHKYRLPYSQFPPLCGSNSIFSGCYLCILSYGHGSLKWRRIWGR